MVDEIIEGCDKCCDNCEGGCDCCTEDECNCGEVTKAPEEKD